MSVYPVYPNINTANLVFASIVKKCPKYFPFLFQGYYMFLLGAGSNAHVTKCYKLSELQHMNKHT